MDLRLNLEVWKLRLSIQPGRPKSLAQLRVGKAPWPRCSTRLHVFWPEKQSPLDRKRTGHREEELSSLMGIFGQLTKGFIDILIAESDAPFQYNSMTGRVHRSSCESEFSLDSHEVTVNLPNRFKSDLNTQTLNHLKFGVY